MKLEDEFFQELAKVLLPHLVYIEESNENTDVIF